MLLGRFKPDLVILDEAQRIKNFSPKTADAVKIHSAAALRSADGHPRWKTGWRTSIRLFSSWIRTCCPAVALRGRAFHAQSLKKGKILGYRNLDRLHTQLKPLVIRRRKEEVLRELPQELINNYYWTCTTSSRKSIPATCRH